MKKHPKNIKKKTLDSKKLPVLLQLIKNLQPHHQGRKSTWGTADIFPWSGSKCAFRFSCYLNGRKNEQVESR